jgi:hypothetical protein
MDNFGHYFETKTLGAKTLGERWTYRKSPARSIDVEHRQALTLRSMIAEVDHSIMALDRSIEVEQELSRGDRSHYAYPMTARALEKRRDNLKMTRNALAQRLSSFKDPSLALT